MAYTPRKTFLPFSLPDLDESELEEIRSALDSNWITTGPKTKQFEKEFALAVNAKHAVAVNSCTAAMHLALDAVGLKPGDEVITTPYTFAATAEVVRYFDARPVFVDIRAEDFNIDPEKIRTAVTDQTKAILPVHVGGAPADMDPICEITRNRGLAVIEDAAHTFPCEYKGKKIGSIGNATCFSFYATKTITTGEGGMICTDRDDWADRCRIMSLHGISTDAWKRYSAEGSWYYEIIAPGFKYNMTDVAAAMGLAQLRKAERMRVRREKIARQYNLAFQDIPSLRIPFNRQNCLHAWHLYMLRLRFDRLSIDRARFIEELKNRNIGCSVHFIPLHVHPYYTKTYGFKPEDFPVALQEYQREISLPVYSKMSDEDVQDVIDAVLDVAEKFNKR
jgi:dTDP-4-amino-4,6-dideoxygalactose transaminase